MTSYYRKFIKSYAKIASPITALLKKDVKFIWTEQCEEAFDTLKKALTSAPILAFPKFNRPFILATDSSDFSIGYVLSQLGDDGQEHPIAYGGRALHGHETKWHITDKEGLALVEAISTFRPYLSNTSFTVFTDNVSVKWLKQIKNCQGRLGRWALALQGYNFQIQHRASSANGNADGLSRRTYDTGTNGERTDAESSDECAMVGQISSNSTKELAAVTLLYSHEQSHTPTVAPATTSTETAPKPKQEYDSTSRCIL
jgi:RNase H-like domain found in reverse transcriptase